MGRECDSYVELDLTTSQSSQGSGMGDRTHQNTRTPPNCARCRNHEVILPLKGHKRYCRYIDCKCEKCLLTAERQKVMARQTAIRRAEEQDRQRIKKGLPVPGRMTPPPPRRSPPPDNSLLVPHLESQSPGPATTATSTSRRSSSPARTQSNTSCTKNGKEMWDRIILLLNWCGFPVNTTPLLHIILSEYNSDVDIVYSRIMKAQEELKKTCPIREEVTRRQSTAPLEINPLSLYCPPVPQPPPGLYKQHLSHYHPTVTLPSFRYHPYQVLPPFKSGVLRGVDPFSYSLPLHESPRPSVLMSTECYYKSDDLKPVSPSSEYSDKSSYSGSV